MKEPEDDRAASGRPSEQGMRRGFVGSVLVFGFVVATAFAAYARWGMGTAWPTVLKFWLVLFGALALFPLGMGYAHRTAESLPLGLFRNRRARRDGDGGRAGRP